MPGVEWSYSCLCLFCAWHCGNRCGTMPSLVNVHIAGESQGIYPCLLVCSLCSGPSAVPSIAFSWSSLPTPPLSVYRPRPLRSTWLFVLQPFPIHGSLWCGRVISMALFQPLCLSSLSCLSPPHAHNTTATHYHPFRVLQHAGMVVGCPATPTSSGTRLCRCPPCTSPAVRLTRGWLCWTNTSS